MSDDRTAMSARPLARKIVLGTIVFVATVALLLGMTALIGSDPVGSATVSPPPASAVPGTAGASPSPTFSAEASGTPEASEPAASGGPYEILVGAGDIADCGRDSDAKTADLVDAIEGTVFTAGDNAYPIGSSADFRDCYEPTWGRFLARTRPAPGNHDHLTRLDGYLGYFGAAATPEGTVWYSYDLGTWHIIVLDSNCNPAGGCGPDSKQGRWLSADLEASAALCTLAIWHHPRWSSGEHGSNGAVAPFWRALFDAGADVVVNGHDHDYERFKPQDPDGRVDQDRGLREFVVGTGGTSLRSFDTTANNSALRVAGIHGVIRFELQPAGYGWRFISTTGELTDSGQGSCH